MSLEQLHQRTALRFNPNTTNRTIRVTQSYMTTWYTVTATECWLGSKILELTMIVMIGRDMNFIPVIRSIVQICLLSNSTNPLLFVSISTWRTVPFESHNHTWTHGIQSQPQSVDLAQNTRTQNDRHVRTRHEFHTSDTFNCTNMSFKHLHQRTALRFILNMTNRTIRVTQSYMATWYTVTASQPQSADLAQKYSNSQWSSWSNETCISYQWYVQLDEYVS